MPIFPIIAALLVIEGLAFWWMHPAPSGLGQPVLSWNRRATPTGNASSGGQADTGISRVIEMPEVVARTVPILRCDSGKIVRVERADGIALHLAFFGWDLKKSVSTLEAYKHLPDECMGSIGLQLTKKHPPRIFSVGNEPISFDHTQFRSQRGEVIHAFKGTWISGGANILDLNERGGGEEWRSIRYRAALQRFRPAHARVVQGAVHGVTSPDHAWDVFRAAILDDLEMQPAQASGIGSSISSD